MSLLNACNTKKQQVSNSDFPRLEGSFFAQKLPGLTPEVFAPDIVSVKGRNESAVSFSPDLDEFYFTTKKRSENFDGTVYFSRLENKNGRISRE